jgi:hypothetical protein
MPTPVLSHSLSREKCLGRGVHHGSIGQPRSVESYGIITRACPFFLSRSSAAPSASHNKPMITPLLPYDIQIEKKNSNREILEILDP